MSYAQNGSTRIYYEVFGERGAPAVLLLGGAGRQSLDYDDRFCGRLAAAGFRAIRFDSRDTGLSTAFSERPSGLVQVFEAVREGRSPILAYDLADMAEDAVSVLDAEGETSARLFARSLGAAVAQYVALSRPGRVRSLTLVMPFSRSLAPTVTPEGLARLDAEHFADEDAYAGRQTRSAQVLGSPAHLDLALVEADARAAFRRGVHAGATARHFAVGIAAPDMRAHFAKLAVPTLVIHGALDRVIPLAFAEETAAAIPGARLEVLPDMAHDGPPAIRDRWLDLFLEQAVSIAGRAS